MVIKEEQFNDELGNFSSLLLGSMEAFFTSKGHTFCRNRFAEQSSVDLDQLGRDAFFFGADIFPDTSTQVTAAA